MAATLSRLRERVGLATWEPDLAVARWRTLRSGEQKGLGKPVGVAHQNPDDPEAASPRHPATPTA
jgi:hypothetical protein